MLEADAFYQAPSGDQLFFGTDPLGSTFFAQIIGDSGDPDYFNDEEPTRFAGRAAVPLPLPAALLLTGLGAIAFASGRKAA